MSEDDKDIMGRFAFDGAEGIAFHIYDAPVYGSHVDPGCVTEIKFDEIETLVEFLRYNFPGLFVYTPPADDVREALARRVWDWNVDLERAVLDDCREIADGILAAFEVRPRGPVTDAEVEHAAREYHERGNGAGSFDLVEGHVRASLLFRMRAALNAARGA